MKTIKTLLAGAALATVMAAAPASAAILDFQITHNGSLYDSFSLDTDTAVASSYPDYAVFKITGSSQGFDGAFFGNSSTNFDFGFGNFANANTVWYGYNNQADGAAPFFDLNGLNLTILKASSTLANGDVISVSSAVPEPATWALMFVGFGLVAGAARYRRRNTTATFA